jgi:hypothetical protein
MASVISNRCHHHQQQERTKLVEEDETSVTRSSCLSLETLSSMGSAELQDEAVPNEAQYEADSKDLPEGSGSLTAPLLKNYSERSIDVTAASSPPSSEGDLEEVMREPTPDVNEQGTSSRRVKFNHVEIREYPRCLGNNPSVRSGPPVSIEWDHCFSYTVDLQFYESDRYIFEKDSSQEVSGEDQKTSDDSNDGNYHRERKNVTELQLDANKRYQILMEDCCISRSEIQDCMAKIMKDKENRRISIALHQQFEHIIIPYESCVRKLKRWRAKRVKKGTSAAA